jgi:hypothetical protein
MSLKKKNMNENQVEVQKKSTYKKNII